MNTSSWRGECWQVMGRESVMWKSMQGREMPCTEHKHKKPQTALFHNAENISGTGSWRKKPEAWCGQLYSSLLEKSSIKYAIERTVDLLLCSLRRKDIEKVQYNINGCIQLTQNKKKECRWQSCLQIYWRIYSMVYYMCMA